MKTRIEARYVRHSEVLIQSSRSNELLDGKLVLTEGGIDKTHVRKDL